MIQKLKNKIEAFAIYRVVRSAGFEWLLLLIPLGLLIFFGWMFFDGINSGEFKKWYSTSISDMQIKDILIIGLIVGWFSRSSCDCKSDK